MEQACCAHLTVKWATEEMTPGRFIGWWECKDCKQRFIPIALAEHRDKELRDAANTLIDYIEAHGWGSIPEPYDSINPLLKLLGRNEAKS